MSTARRLHQSDLARGLGAVWLPDALQRKYPNAPREFGWQYVFPATRLWTTMIYTHVLQRMGGRGMRSPLDRIEGSEE